ncbi:MAG: SPOR domain-containing protein [Pseudomonadota bacterium]
MVSSLVWGAGSAQAVVALPAPVDRSAQTDRDRQGALIRVQVKPAKAAAQRRGAIKAAAKLIDRSPKRALKAFSGIIDAGGLNAPDMARALYYRGLAHRKLGLNARAISDLTSAMWLKGGLSPAMRTRATAERRAAYAAAGVTASGPTQAARASRPARPAATSQRRPRPTVAQRPTRATTAPRSVAARPTPQPARPATPPPTPAKPSASSGGGIAGFFSGLFGGGSSAPQPRAVAAPARPVVAPAGPRTAVSGWNSRVAVAGQARRAQAPRTARPATRAPQRRTAVPRAKAPRKVGAQSRGRYKLLLAPVRSQAEAQRQAALLRKRFASALATRTPTVERTVLGNMGAFYRVQVGSFEKQGQPRALCGRLRASGIDCMLAKR